MGEIKVRIELENVIDRYLFMEGKIQEGEIKRYETEAVVDTGAVMLFLPQDIVGTWFKSSTESGGDLCR